MNAQRTIERIGRKAAQEQDRARPMLDEERGLARFRAAVDATVVEPGRSRRWLAASLCAGLAAVVLVLAWPRAAITFAVEGGAEVAVAQWIDAREPTDVSFSDGTQIAAALGSRWRVSQTTPVGASVQLERGELLARVQSTADSQWLVDAGPFSIRVTGTRFTTSWNPVGEVFELHMHEGSVVLAGPIVGGQREVRAPEHLRVEVKTQKLSVVAPEANPSEPVDEPVSPPDTPATTTASPSTSAAPAAAMASAAPKAASWAKLASAGRYAEALSLVQEMNAAALLATESAAGLMLLAQTARLGGDQALAARALTSLSQRFPDSVQAKTAQFLAGKLHYDRGQYDSAITKLSGYLAAGAGGTFAGEAQVLLILALHHAGRVGEARALAGPYLQRHPDGPHAARIRSVVAPNEAP